MMIDNIYRLLRKALNIKRDWVKKTCENGNVIYESRTAGSNYIMETPEGITIEYSKRNVLDDAYSYMFKDLRNIGIFDRYNVRNVTQYRGLITFTRKA